MKYQEIIHYILALMLIGVVMTSGCMQETPQQGVQSTVEQASATRISYQEKPDGFPSMFQLDDGTLWVVFKSKPSAGTNVHLVTSEDKGETWLTDNPMAITESRANAEHTSLVQKDDLIVLAWDNGNLLRYSISPDNGNTWKQKDLELGKARYPYIYEVDGELWYVFITIEDGDGGIIKYMTSGNGNDWREVGELIKNPDQSGEFAIYGNPILYKRRGELWLLWDTGAEAAPTSDIWWMKSLDSGETWEEPKVLTMGTATLDDVDPSICEYNGKPLLVYASRPEGELQKDYKIYYKTYGDNGWSEPVKLGEPYNYPGEHVLDWYPSCFTDNNGKIWLTWASNRLSAEKSDSRIDVEEDNREIFVAPLELG